jgi:hypothetical protein
MSVRHDVRLSTMPAIAGPASYGFERTLATPNAPRT